MKKYKATEMLMPSGKIVNLTHLRGEDICLDDIVHSLKNMYRFGGRFGNRTLTVLEHSLAVAHEADEKYIRAALLHDAAEAYVGDIAAPVKTQCADIIQLENNILGVIFEKFRIPYSHYTAIKKADRTITAIEIHTLAENKNIREQFDAFLFASPVSLFYSWFGEV